MIGKKWGDFNLMEFEIIDGQITSIDEILANAQTAPLLSMEKCLWIKNCKLLEKSGSKEEASFFQLLHGDLPPQNTIFFTQTKVDQRLKTVTEIKKTAHWEELEVSEESLREFVQETLKKNQKTMDSKTCDFLIVQTGENISILSSELEKMITYVGAKKLIGIEDVEAVVSPSKEEPFFKFVDEILTGKSVLSIKTLRSLIQQKENPIGLITHLLNTLRLLIQARSLIEEGFVEERKIPASFRKTWLEELNTSLPENIKKAFPKESHLLKQHPYRLFLLMQQAKKFTLKRLKDLFLKSCDTYWDLVNSRSAEHALEKLALGV